MKSILSRYGLGILGDGPIHDRPKVNKRHFELFYILGELLQPKIVLEIGSWEGSSALSWSEVVKRTDGIVICVDTWLGSVEHYEDKLSGSEWGRQRLELEDGFPTVYKTFVSNIRFEGFQEYVIPMPIDSHQAFIILKNSNICPDITYIDASHDYESVLKDLNGAKNINSKIICGDDYYYWDNSEVKEAVDFFADSNDMRIITKQNQFVLLDTNQENIYQQMKDLSWNDR